MNSMLISSKYYLGGEEYMNNSLEAYYHEEGRITPKPGNAWQYEYTIKDHLGNGRVYFADLNNDEVINAATELLQVQDYYPFGLQHGGTGATQVGVVNKYQYNGKEFNDEFGLNELDYHARGYDPITARFNSVDPHAENYTPLSSYVYCANNPIIYVDPNGKDFYYSSDGSFIGEYGKKTTDVFMVDKGTFKSGDGKLSYDESSRTQLKLGDGTNVTHNNFKELAGTVMGEMDKNQYTAKEGAAMYSVLENRAKESNKNEYDVAKSSGVYGWDHRDNIDKKDFAEKAKVTREGMMKAMTNSTDYSNGAYFWHGRDFHQHTSGSGAYENYYLVGFKFIDPNHDYKQMGDHQSGKNGYNYVYNSTSFEGRTTFMKYDEKWKKSQKHTKNYP